MNFIKFLFKNRFFFFFCLLFLSYSSSKVKADILVENQLIKHEFALPSSYLGTYIHDFCFDPSGTLFVATNDRLGIYRGEEWQFLNLKGVPLLSVNESGNVFFALDNYMYALKIDSALNYKAVKLFTIPGKNSFIKEIVGQGNVLLVNTGTRIYSWLNQSLQEIYTNQDGTSLYQTKSRLIVGSGKMLAHYSPLNGIGKFVTVPFIPRFISDHPDGYLLYSGLKNSFSLLSPKFTKTGNFEIEGFHFSDILHYSGNLFAGTTSDSRIVLFSGTGTTFQDQIISTSDYIPKMRISPYGRIWLNLGHSFFIYQIESEMQNIKVNSLNGKINWIDFADSELLLASSEGISVNNSGPEYFDKQVEKIESKWFGTFALSENKLYLINRNSNLFLNDSISCFYWDEKVDKLFFLRNHQIGFFDFSSFINTNAREIIMDEAVIRMSAGQGRLIYLTENYLGYRNLVEEKDDKLDLPYGVTTAGIRNMKIIGENLFLNTNSGIYCISLLQGIDRPPEFISDANSFVFVYNPEYYAIQNGFELKLFSEGKEEEMYFPPGLISNISLSGIYVWEGESVILNCKNELFFFQTKKKNPDRKLKIQVHSLKLNEDEVFAGTDFNAARIFLRKQLNSIPYRNNRLELIIGSSDFFSIADFIKYNLKKRKNIFDSNWKKTDLLVLENLQPGNYRLDIFLKNDMGVDADPLFFSFKVKRPVYLSTFSFIIYFVFLMAVLFVFYRRYMIRKHNAEEIKKTGIQVEAFHKAEPVENPSVVKKEFDFNLNSGDRKSKWDKYQMVTVLFSDIQGFTKIAESMNPERLIDELDQFFFHFDSVVDKYDIEKIKTIGDAYMAAGGIPRRNCTNPVEVVLAAIEMQQYMKQLKRTKVDIWDLRIGIHTGPVIAGVIGSKKRSYDIWGDSVNIASRMESSGEAGKINISGETYMLVKEFFLCEYRGKIPVKYKGNLDMFFVKGLRPELSINLVGLPNRKFFLKLQIDRLNDLEEFVFDKLQNELPSGTYFHTAEYSRSVYDFAYLLAKSENLDLEESLLVRTAALFLNIGYISNYNNPEVESAEMSRSVLLNYKYTERQIHVISNLILSVRPPFEPVNTMEKILVDSKMSYLGRPDFLKIYKLKFLEDNELGKSVSPTVWKKQQMKIIKEFRYFTAAARRLSEIPLDDQLRNIENDILG